MFDGWLPGLDEQAGLGIAILLTILFVLARIRYLALPKLPPRSPGGPIPDCMVVIPARNEAPVIARAVKSLPHDTVIVVDDGSEDGTAEIARKSGAGVIPAPPIPEKGLGKPNACLAGARHLTSKWILFADADTWYEPGFLESAVACAEANGIALLSIYPRIECGTLAERVLSPYAAALFFAGIDGRADPAAIFNGKCLLARRSAYEFIGAHAAVMNTITDDVKLAGLAKRHRLQFATVRAEGLAHVELRDPSEEFRRGALRFMSVSGWMGITVMAAGGLAALWLPMLIWLLMEGHWTGAALFGIWPIVLATPWYRNPLRALATPVAIYWMAPILWSGMTRALAGVRIEWKGREV